MFLNFVVNLLFSLLSVGADRWRQGLCVCVSVCRSALVCESEIIQKSAAKLQHSSVCYVRALAGGAVCTALS